MEAESRTPTLGHIVRAAVGFIALGAVGTFDPAAPFDAAFAQVAPSGLMVNLGALALTGPTLLVAHPFLGLQASPDALVSALARTFARAGDLALGLVPFLVFFAATTQLATVLLAMLLGFVGATALIAAGRDLVRAETDAEGSNNEQVAKMHVLATAWCVLTLFAAARVGFEVLA